jgi:hypothetical protein
MRGAKPMSGIITASTGMTKNTDAVEERAEPEGRVPLPEARSRPVNASATGESGRSFGWRRELAQLVERSLRRMNGAHRLE